MVLGVLGLGFYDMVFSLLSSLVVVNNCMGGFECGEGQYRERSERKKNFDPPTLVYMRGA